MAKANLGKAPLPLIKPPRWSQPLLKSGGLILRRFNPDVVPVESRLLTLTKLSLCMAFAACLVSLTMPRDEKPRSWRRWASRLVCET